MPARGEEGNSKESQLDCSVGTEVVVFPRSSASLDQAARKTLNRVAEWMKSDDERQAEVEGYASSGAEVANTGALSIKRARAVENYLQQQGIDSQRVESFGRGAGIPEAPVGKTTDTRVAVVKSCQPVPAPLLSMVEQAPPPPTPTPTGAPEVVPPETPTPMAPPVETMPPPAPPGPPAVPGEEGVHARGYQPRPLSGLGVALTAGGGVAGFFNSGARDAASDGFTWDVRLTLGTRIPLGLDLAYLGSVQGMNVPGLDSDALLVGNGAEAALRVQLPYGMVRPYLTGGVGWTHYSVQDTGLVSGLREGDTIGTIPFGVGVAVGNVNGFTFDLRAVGRIAFADDLLDNLSPDTGSDSLNSWGVTARLGGEF